MICAFWISMAPQEIQIALYSLWPDLTDPKMNQKDSAAWQVQYQRWHQWMDWCIYRSSFPCNIVFSCKFSLQPIHWIIKWFKWCPFWSMTCVSLGLKTVIDCCSPPKETNHLKELVQAHRGIVDMFLGRPAGPWESSATMLGFPDTSGLFHKWRYPKIPKWMVYNGKSL